MALLDIFLPAPGTVLLPTLWSVVEADYLESIFGVIQDFHNTPGWCGTGNIKERGITASSFVLGQLVTDGKTASDTLTPRVLSAAVVNGTHIAPAAIRDYHINWLTPAGMLVNAHSDTYPAESYRMIVGPISFGIGDTTKVETTLLVSTLEGTELFASLAEAQAAFANVSVTARPTLVTTETFEVLHRIAYSNLLMDYVIDLRVMRSDSSAANTVYVEVLAYGV
jgi:hypothetical protein